MTTPNVVKVVTINGNTSVSNVTTVATSVVTNASGSNKLYKVNALYISNYDISNTNNVIVDIYSTTRTPTTTYITYQTAIPPASTLDVISKAIYLIENDSIRLTSSANSKLHAVTSWEEIS